MWLAMISVFYLSDHIRQFANLKFLDFVRV